jgi:hypothetical protein
MFVTLIPWLMLFGVLHLFLMIFPGWMAPFANTFGYLVAKLMVNAPVVLGISPPPVFSRLNHWAAMETAAPYLLMMMLWRLPVEKFAFMVKAVVMSTHVLVLAGVWTPCSVQ